MLDIAYSSKSRMTELSLQKKLKLKVENTGLQAKCRGHHLVKKLLPSSDDQDSQKDETFIGFFKKNLFCAIFMA